MKLHRNIAAAVVALGLGVQAGHAACYADYKAKQDNPLRLHYGVIELPDRACGSKSDAKATISKKIGRDGWKVLKVIGIFDQSGLQERKKSAGAYFLKY